MNATTTITDLTAVVDGYLAAYGEPDAALRAERIRTVWRRTGA